MLPGDHRGAGQGHRFPLHLPRWRGGGVRRRGSLTWGSLERRGGEKARTPSSAGERRLQPKADPRQSDGASTLPGAA